MSIIQKLIKGEMPTDQELENYLWEICDKVHSSCDNRCPIYKAMDGETTRDEDGNCYFFRSGSEMLKYLRQINN